MHEKEKPRWYNEQNQKSAARDQLGRYGLPSNFEKEKVNLKLKDFIHTKLGRHAAPRVCNRNSLHGIRRNSVELQEHYQASIYAQVKPTYVGNTSCTRMAPCPQILAQLINSSKFFLYKLSEYISYMLAVCKTLLKSITKTSMRWQT